MSILQFSKRISKRLLTAFVVLSLTSFFLLKGQVADFDFIISKKCAPTLVTFQNKSTTGGGIEYLWDFDKGSQVFSTQMVLEEVFSFSGTYNVTLKVIDGIDTVKKSKVITIFEGPTARFTVSDSIGCAPQNIQLNDASSQGDAAITEHFWDFRNGQTSTTKNINTTFTNAGSYDIYYRVTDNNGCSADLDTKSRILINEPPVANFRASEVYACSPPLVVEFENLSTGNGDLRASWDFGNGINSYDYSGTVTYTETGNYDVKLVLTDDFGCVGTIIRNSYIGVGANTGQLIVSTSGSEFIDDSVRLCPDSVLFTTNLSPEVTKDWQFVYNGITSNYFNRDEIVMEMIDSGTVSVQLIYGSNTLCPDTISRTYFIDWIEAAFSFEDDYSCSLPESVRTVNTSQNGSDYTWLLPDTTTSTEQDIDYIIQSYYSHDEVFSHTTNYKSFLFTLVSQNTNGCTDTARNRFNIALPVARFMPDKSSGCVPLEVTFSDSSKSEEVIVSRKYLVDGIKVNDNDGQPFTHIFTSEGEYQVQLVIENISGCIDTSYAVKIKVGGGLSPSASVSPAIVCPGSEVSISNQTATIPPGVKWNYAIPGVFNSGSTEQTEVSSFIRSDVSGEHSLVITANYNGCISSDTVQDAINIQGPVGSFTESFSCETPFDYTFSSDLDSITSVSWLVNGVVFGDQPTVSYTFPSSGDYIVQHTGIHSGTGCTLVKEKRIKVRDVQAVITPQPYACLVDPVFFMADSSVDYIDSCYNEGFLWDFGDGLPSRKTYKTFYKYNYADTGSYRVWLQVEGDNGCLDTAVTSIKIVAPKPEFTVDINSGCAPVMDIQFDYTNKTDDINSWIWDFGDGDIYIDTISTQLTHTYSSGTSRNFYPSLVVTDIYGCVGYASDSLYIEKPIAEFQAYDSSKCLNEQVAFNYISRSHDSLLMHFGDGEFSASTFRHAYDSPGLYDVSFTVYKDGCEATNVRENYVLIEGVEADYSVSDTIFDCYPVTVSFEHLGVAQTKLDGQWDFGNGSVSDGYSKTVQYTYTRPGTYQTNLSVVSENNCKAEASREIVITGPYIDFQFEPARICSGGEVQFKVIDTIDIEGFEWVFGDGSTSVDLNPVHTYLAKGPVIPAISVENNNCQVLLTGDTLHVAEVTAEMILLNGMETCQYQPLIAENNSDYFQEMFWYLEGDLISQDTNLNYIATTPGNFELLMRAVDVDGCADSTQLAIVVNPTPEFIISGVNSLCPGDQSTLQVRKADSDWQISWIPPDKVENPADFTTSTKIDSTTLFVAEVENEFGCISVNSIRINVGEILNLNRMPMYDTTIFIGQDVQLQVLTDRLDVEYSWSPDYNISCTNCSSPVVYPYEYTEYVLTVSDSCTSKRLVFPVEVIIDFYLEFPSAFTPNGDGMNDVFVYEYDKLSEIDFSIYNRWGTRVFRSTRLGEGWNGEINGQVQGVDSFTYYVRAVSEHGFEFEKKGSFSIIK